MELAQGWTFPGKLQPVADRIGARDIALFHGTIEMEKLNFIEKSMVNTVKAPIGDFRDWEAIAAWAQGIAAALQS